MKKNVSWKKSLLIAFISYALKFSLGAYLPTIITALLEIIGLTTFVLGVIGGLKTAFDKSKKKS